MNEILKEALALGLIDIFTLVNWWSNQTPDEEILQNLLVRVQAAKARDQQVLN